MSSSIRGMITKDDEKPTFENVAEYFIQQTLNDILFHREYPNFNVIFGEQEALEYVNKIAIKHKDSEFAEKIAESLRKPKADRPSLIINDYKYFFEALRGYHEKHIELFFQDPSYTGYPETGDSFKNLWLRATTEDFANAEKFLERQVQMINDKTFKKFDAKYKNNEREKLGTVLESSPSFENNVICVDNGFGGTYDENVYYFNIMLLDKDKNPDGTAGDNFHKFPLIRYGIYEKDGEKICYIGSIKSSVPQSTSNPKLKKVYRDVRFRHFKNENSEPTHLLALGIFINFLHNEGITKIQAPKAGYILDDEFHRKLQLSHIRIFDEWTEDLRKSAPKLYEAEKKAHDEKMKRYNLNIIKVAKTTRFVGVIKSLLSHYPASQITSQSDSFLNMEIPIPQSENDIIGPIFHEMKSLVDGYYKENVRGINNEIRFR